MIPEPKLLPFPAPCVRCGKIRRLVESSGLCWMGPPELSGNSESSCWHGERFAAWQDGKQDMKPPNIGPLEPGEVPVAALDAVI